MTTTTADKTKLPLKEIAVRVRADIKAAIKAGKLPAFKVSVRTDYYSMGCSLDVVVKAVPAGYLVANAAHVAWEMENPHSYFGAAPEAARSNINAQAAKDLATLDAIVRAYHRDDSDMMTDYYSVNFAKRVSFASELRRDQESELRASLKASEVCPVVRVEKREPKAVAAPRLQLVR